MATKEFNARVTHKHDTEAHWALAENFSPLQGEIIIYDEDDNNLSKRFKIGDGETNVNDLPFISAGGIYVGSGAMPDGYDIQINPNGVVDTGANGKSAYEIAQDAGFEGTEAEWLTSIQGSDVYKPWTEVANIILENDVGSVEQDFPTNTYKESYIEAELKIAAPEQTTSKSTRFDVMRRGMMITTVWVNVKDGDTLYLCAKGWISPTKRQIYDVAASTYKYAYGTVNRNPGDMSSLDFDYLDKIIVSANANGVNFGTGSTVKIWGR